jgi:membrane protein
MPARAALLDLDGTLVDSNSLHVHAFAHAFSLVGIPIAPDRIAAEIGKGGDTLIPSILGPDTDRRLGEKIRSHYKHRYAHLAREQGLHFFPRAIELINALKSAGLRVALATSSAGDQLDLVARVTGTDLRQHADAFTTSDDADTSKPAPDLWTTAADKLGLLPAQCFAVGDSLFDHTSARRAGVSSLALATWPPTGSDLDLRRAGARAVYRDAADLLAHLPQALELAHPLRFDLTASVLDRLLQPAFDAARANLTEGGAPIAAALYDRTGKLLATGANRSHVTSNPLDHAEITALHNATTRGDFTHGLLACTLEPCVMCTGAAMETCLDTLLFALKAPADNGSVRVAPPQSPNTTLPRALHHIPRQAEARQLFEAFLSKTTNPAHAAFTGQLLSLT